MVTQGYWTHSRRRPVTGRHGPVAARHEPAQSVTPRQAAPRRPPAARPSASSSSARRRGRRVEVVVERGPHRRPARRCRRRRRRARCATAPGGPPPPACPRRSASPSPLGSGGPARPAAPPPGPTPCTGRRRRRGCRATSTSSCRPSPTRPTWNQSRTKRLAGHRLGLRRLALVVREHEVAAAAVDVDRLAELAQHQRRALDVPARPSRPPTRLPRRLVGQRRLPQHEVERVPLVRVLGLPPCSAASSSMRARSKPLTAPNAAKRRHAEVDRAARLVGEAALERGADQRQDLGDGRRRPRLGVHRQQVEQAHLGVEARHLLGRQVEVVHAELPGLAQDVVVDVGDVAHAPRLVPGVLQAPLQHVEVEVDGGVPEVRRVVRA